MHIYYCNTLICESVCRRENNTEMAVKKVGCEWLTWLMIGASGGLLWA